MQTHMTAGDEQQFRTLQLIIGLAAVTTLVAVAAGLVLLVVDPVAGSTEEAALGLTAAVAGLATAVLAISALVYAQVKNLWRFAPTWFRIAAGALIIAAIGYTLLNLASGLFQS